ncbi:MAG: MraY family glycosyltransferase [Burkholderiaceae bacterium]|jgi:UDP-N-acetylmuramyl pentapeptide phosphotransferase/UDP-N-acetylglucosamine-1-phosphate transferase
MWISIFTIAGLSFLLSLGIVFTKGWHGRFSIDSTAGIQKSHTSPTPRVGGLGIYSALWAAVVLIEGEAAGLLAMMLLAGLPAFGMGLLEDLTKRVGVPARLVATAVTGALAVGLTGYGIRRLGLGGWETALLGMAPVSLVLTSFAVSGLSNAVNIIDGFNGLASGAVMLMLTGLGMVAYFSGDQPLVVLCALGFAAVLGFLCVNFPLGKLFLGDGGAYFIGFYVGWIAIMLIARNPEVSPFAALLVLGYPVLETLFSIARRRHRKLNPGMPDRLHLHSLVKRRVSAKIFRKLPPVYRNSFVAPMGWAYALLPVVCAVCFYRSSQLCILGFLIAGLLYAVIYARLVTFHWCSPIRYVVPGRFLLFK